MKVFLIVLILALPSLGMANAYLEDTGGTNELRKIKIQLLGMSKAVTYIDEVYNNLESAKSEYLERVKETACYENDKCDTNYWEDYARKYIRENLSLFESLNTPTFREIYKNKDDFYITRGIHEHVSDVLNKFIKNGDLDSSVEEFISEFEIEMQSFNRIEIEDCIFSLGKKCKSQFNSSQRETIAILLRGYEEFKVRIDEEKMLYKAQRSALLEEIKEKYGFSQFEFYGFDQGLKLKSSINTFEEILYTLCPEELKPDLLYILNDLLSETRKMRRNAARPSQQMQGGKNSSCDQRELDRHGNVIQYTHPQLQHHNQQLHPRGLRQKC